MGMLSIAEEQGVKDFFSFNSAIDCGDKSYDVAELEFAKLYAKQFEDFWHIVWAT